MRKKTREELQRPNSVALSELPKTPLVLVLDNVRSLLNIGSIFRTADSFRLESVFLCGITGKPPHREIQKTALGATDTVPWKYFSHSMDAMLELESLGYQIWALEQTIPSTSVFEFKPEQDQKYAVVLGNEVHGVDEKLFPMLKGCIEIPQSGAKHSLNISVSAGILAFRFFQISGKFNSI